MSLPGRSSKEFCDRLPTPALVYDETRLKELATMVSTVRELASCKILYAVKACAWADVLRSLAPSTNGFAVSSLFEARLVRELHPESPVHLTTPGLRADEVRELASCATLYLSTLERNLRALENPSIGKPALGCGSTLG